MRNPIRLILADDHSPSRGGEKLNGSSPKQRRRATAALIHHMRSVHPLNNRRDVLLLDLQRKRWTFDEIRQLAGHTNVLVLTASESMNDAITAMRLGARGVVQKQFAVQTLIDAIRAVARGLVWMPPILRRDLVGQWGASGAKQLTAREVEIARHVARGLRNAEIAGRLSITEATVKTHLNNIFDKLGLRDRVELAVYALKHGGAVAPDQING
jgi:two-component system, NarL family, nitrate/nitrite response regulator NarL